MTELIKIQRLFFEHLFNESNKEILNKIPYSKEESLARLNIYRNNVFGGVESLLSSAFPVIEKILGTEKFAKLTMEYQKSFPSKSGDLNGFCNNFPKFIKNFKPLYLKDLAILELAYHHSYFSPKTSKKFDLKKLKKIPEADFSKLKFKIYPFCTFFEFNLPIFSIWKNEKFIKKNKKEYVIVYLNRVVELSQEEFLFLKEVKKGKNLYKIYQNLTKKTNQEVNIGAIINKFISNELLIDFILKNNERI